MKRFWDLYLDGADGRAPRRLAAAGRRPRRAAARVHPHGARTTSLRDEGEAYARALEAAGVPVDAPPLRRRRSTASSAGWRSRACRARAVAEVGGGAAGGARVTPRGRRADGARTSTPPPRSSPRGSRRRRSSPRRRSATACWLKLETLQPTGSFKVRGALAALARRGRRRRSSPPRRATRGSASRGRRPRSACAATIVVAETASPAKVAALRGAAGRRWCSTAPTTTRPRRTRSRSPRGAPTSPPTTTRASIAGQATLGRELDARAGAATVVAPLGGGRLASGLGLWAAARRGRARRRRRGGALAGVLHRAGRGRDHADRGRRHARRRPRRQPRARLGHVPAGPRPRRRRRRRAEAEIEEAIRFLARAHGLVAEGAGAAAAAAVLRGAGRAGRRRRSWSSSAGATSRSTASQPSSPAHGSGHALPDRTLRPDRPRVALVFTAIFSDMITGDRQWSSRSWASCSCRGRRSPTSCSTTSARARVRGVEWFLVGLASLDAAVGRRSLGRTRSLAEPRRRLRGDAPHLATAAGGAGSANAGGAMLR